VRGRRYNGIRARAAAKRFGLTAIAAFLLVTPVEAQIHGPRMGRRADLEARLNELQNRLGLADADARDQISEEMAGIARRLREGDVYPGDLIDLRVGGETRWTERFTVTPARQIELPDIDPIDVSNALFSELEESLSVQFARYLREPRVQATVLKRVGITGDVASPGFFVVDGSSLISDVLMQAGGPGPSAKLDDLQVRRLGRSLDVGKQIVWQSLSLDQLGVQSGDELFLPTQGQSFPMAVLGVLGSVAGLTWALLRIF
jgi:hypothetical protein